ncbi:MAG: creatininase family protein [Alphaproteobacteria bacterium]|nr:creatininase family protein [Alphaproteobacteria bacterium]
MRLQLMTWQEVETYLSHSRGVIVPIGSTEQHGPNGLIGTDAITAEAVAQAVGDKAGVVVAPTINVGMAVHHMRFPGSMTLRPSTLLAVIRDTVTSLAAHGFTRIMFINGHGGNIATLNAAFYEIYADPPPGPGGRPAAVRCTLLNWFLGPGVGQLSRDLFGNKEGSHATPSEVALTQHVYPDQVKVAVLDPETAPAGGFYDADDFRRRYPDGRIGSAPGLATPAKGAQVLEAAVADALSAWSAFQEDA